MKNIFFTIIFIYIAFFTPKIVFSSHYILGAEYYIDNDPGEGNGISLLPSDGKFDNNYEHVNSEIDLSNVSVGVHTIFVRMMNEQGKWGISRQYKFEVIGDKDVVEYQYYIQKNNLQNDKIIEEKALTNNNIIELTIDSSTFEVGLYRTFFRLKDSENKWGSYRQKVFEISPPAIIESAAFFINTITDEGIELSPSDGSFNEPDEKMIGEIETYNLEEGSHTVYIKILDSYQRVTMCENTFNILGNSLIKGALTTLLSGSKNPIIGATIILNETEQTTMTNSLGHFVFSDIEPGSYTITVSKNGFKSIELQGIEVHQGETVSLPPIELNTTLLNELNEVLTNYELLLDDYNFTITELKKIESFTEKFDIHNDKRINLFEAINVLKIISNMEVELGSNLEL